MQFNSPQEALNYHVTGAIERGEKQAIAGITLRDLGGELERFLCGEPPDRKRWQTVENFKRGQPTPEQLCYMRELLDRHVAYEKGAARRQRAAELRALIPASI